MQFGGITILVIGLAVICILKDWNKSNKDKKLLATNRSRTLGGFARFAESPLFHLRRFYRSFYDTSN